MGVRIDGNRDLWFSNEPNKLMSTMPKEAFRLRQLSVGLVAWLSRGSERMIWLSNWETYPPLQIVLFGKIRLGCGESRPPLEAPGHLFDSSEDESDLMSGLIFFVMAFNWEAYLVTKNDESYIHLGDEYIVFRSPSNERLKEATELISDFKLEVITDIRSAWK